MTQNELDKARELQQFLATLAQQFRTGNGYACVSMRAMFFTNCDHPQFRINIYDDDHADVEGETLADAEKLWNCRHLTKAEQLRRQADELMRKAAQLEKNQI